MSQEQQILQYMSSGNPLTPIQALDKFGCFRLAARVKDLRDAGHTIYTEQVNKNGKRFARYRMEQG